MISVHAVVDRVGPALIRAVPLTGRAASVSDVVIAEGGRTTVASGDLVLGVAIDSVGAAVELVRHCGDRAAAAVLLKPPHAASASVLAAAREAEVGIIEVQPGAGWAQLVWLLRAVLDAHAAERAAPDDAGTGLDLFRLADAVAAIVDAPVTIEDATSRVVAYSERQDRMDSARVSTIMGRRVPSDVLARFRSRGVFRELNRGGTTIYVPAQPDGTLPRLIVPIRVGGELLGSMWAVVPGPVAAERASAFADTGPVVALHLLRWRARADADRRRGAEQLALLLSGREGARGAAAELGLEPGRHRVVAIDCAVEDSLDAEATRLALWEQISKGVGRRPAVADIDGLLYAVVPDRDAPSGWRSLRDSLAGQSEPVARPGGRAGTRRGVSGEPADHQAPLSPLVAAGSAVNLPELSRSRAQADETMGLLRAGLVDSRVADYEHIWPALVLHRAAAATAGTGLGDLGPLSTLAGRDAADGTAYLDTLYEWLRHPGDPRAASTALGIHPNTFRYRLRRLAELTDADLEDADTRLALLSQLISLRWA